MRIGSNKKFDKMFYKAPDKVKIKFKKRIKILLSNPNEPVLRRHKLSGEYNDYFSIDITGNWRAVYLEKESGNLLFFVLFGTHSQLYK